MSLIPKYFIETLLLPQNFILQINAFWFPEGIWNKALIFVTVISIYWYQLSPINSVTRISIDMYIHTFLIYSVAVSKITVLEFFHDSTAEVLSIISRIFIPNFLKLLCNLYLVVFFHISMFNYVCSMLTIWGEFSIIAALDNSIGDFRSPTPAAPFVLLLWVYTSFSLGFVSFKICFIFWKMIPTWIVSYTAHSLISQLTK